MENVSLLQIFITLFIGMGPVKVLLVYIAQTQDLSKDVRRQVARRTVLVAGGVALGLFIFGVFVKQILHFSIGALTIIGGLILLLLALNMVMGSHGGGKGAASKDPMSIAISPLAIPLMLNPVGIVALVVLSATITDLVVAGAIIVMVVVIALINMGVFLLSDRIAEHLSTAAVELFEKILGIFLGALAVQLILNGLADLGIITLSGGH